VQALLSAGADPNFQHSHGIGSVLCAATFTQNESKRSLDKRIALVRLQLMWHSLMQYLRSFFI